MHHSKHRIVIVSTALSVAAVITFFVYTGLALYKFHSSSAFVYRVTQVLPFPVAKAGKHFVAYENYLFELRRYQHYYRTQQRVDFASKSGRDQLEAYKPKAMNQVIQAVYVKQLAAKYHVSVSREEVNNQLDSLRAQNQSSDQELAEVTKKFFGWSLDDLRRELKQELLAQKVAATMDTSARDKADAVLKQIRAGGDFDTIAKQYSQDPTAKDAGVAYTDTAISLASTDVPSAVVHELLKLKVGQVSGVVRAGDTLEIVKLTANDGGKLQASHISFRVTPITKYVADYTAKHPKHVYIDVK